MLSRYSHLSKWQSATRTKSEISDEELQQCIKKYCPDINKNIASWMESSQGSFIEEHCSLLMSVAKKTYRLNPVQMKKAVYEVYANSDINATLFATKVTVYW